MILSDLAIEMDPDSDLQRQTESNCFKAINFNLSASNSFNIFREEFIQAVGQIRSEEDDENSKVEQESKDLDHDKHKDDSSTASENGF